MDHDEHEGTARLGRRVTPDQGWGWGRGGGVHGRPLTPFPGAGVVRVCREFGLTERETDVMFCVLAGLSNQESADLLEAAVGTIRTHLDRIRLKVGVRRRPQLMAHFGLRIRQAAREPSEGSARTEG